ncbi:MAG: hypothetical protein WDO56_08880 [Gammaproteobacteria bacterium]
MPQQQIALVEMRGDRIYRMRNFGTPPETLVAAMRGRAQSELCASLSRYEGSLAIQRACAHSAAAARLGYGHRFRAMIGE